MNLNVRKMTPDDYQEVRAIWELTPGMKLEQADSEEGVTRYLSRNPSLSYVAEVGDKIIGTVLCGEDGRRGYLQHLCVIEEFRGQGIGKKLLETAIQQFKLLELHEIRIFVFKDNDLGNKFWGDLGWIIRDDIYVRAYNLD